MLNRGKSDDGTPYCSAYVYADFHPPVIIPSVFDTIARGVYRTVMYSVLVLLCSSVGGVGVRTNTSERAGWSSRSGHEGQKSNVPPTAL